MTPETKSLSRFLFAFYLFALVAAIWSLGPRWRAEEQHRTTEIILDSNSLSEWIRQPGTDRSVLLERLKKAGVQSLAVPELHLDDLEETGQVVPLSEAELSLLIEGGALDKTDSLELGRLNEYLETHEAGTYLLFTDPKLARTLLAQWQIIYGDTVETFAQGRVVRLPVAKGGLRSLGLGFDLDTLGELQGEGFSLWLRPENRESFSPEQIEELFRLWGKISGVQGVVFGGGLNQAVGYPEYLETTATALEQLNWKVGYIELAARAQQKGVETLVRSLPGRTARVMAISPPHQAKLTPYRVLGMYSLGSRERNIRALYVRPYAIPSRPELDDEFLFSLVNELEKAGEASVFPDQELQGPGTAITIILGIGGVCLGLALLGELGVPLTKTWLVLLLVPVMGPLAAGFVGKTILYRSLLALAISVVAPTYGFLRWVYPVATQENGGDGYFSGLKLLTLTSLLSLSGGLYLAALLSDVTFLLGLDRFRGVKLLTLGAPLLMVACFILKRYSVAELWKGLRSYVAVYQALLVGLLLAVFGLLYLRTGNDAGAAAGDWERTLRVFLDRLLGVRPRFKEFMIAHPSTILVPFLAHRTGFLPSLVLVLLGGIGQAGIVDTFAHVHTPLDVTLARVVLGVVFGAIIGGAARISVGLLESFTKGYLPTGKDS